MKFLIALFLLAALSSACSVTHNRFGQPLPNELQLAGLEIGVTTKAEALARLGAPVSLRRQFDGELFVWRRSESHSSRLLLIPLFPIYETAKGRGGSDRLALLFDQEGILSGIGLSLETDAAESNADA